MARGRDDEAELARQRAELEEVRPFLDLAREIHQHVQRASGDGTFDATTLVDALEAVPDRERLGLVTSVFARLDPERQWELLAAAYGDEELRRYLDGERRARLEALRRQQAAIAVAAAWRAAQRVDLDDLPDALDLTLGLFRSEDTGAALVRGRRSTVCARQLVLRATEHPGLLRVIDDRYNPQRGFFVTAAYDERVWAAERLEGHALVRLGSPGADGDLEPVLFPGGRVDVEHDGHRRVGRLHLGFVLVGSVDVFSADG